MLKQSELQTSCISKLPNLYDEQYELGYWVGYAQVERIAHGDTEPSSDDASEPPNSMEPIELAGEESSVFPVPTGEGTSKGAWVLSAPIGEGTFELVVAVSIEPIVIILQEFRSVVTGSPRPPFPKDIP